MSGDPSLQTSRRMTVLQAAEYLHRGRRFIRKEIATGRLRGAFVGSHREVLTCQSWCDVWVEDQARVIPFDVAHKRTARAFR